MKKNLLILILAGATVALGLSTTSLLETRERLTTELQERIDKYDKDTSSLEEMISELTNNNESLESQLKEKEDELLALANSVDTLNSNVSTGTFKVTAYSPFDNVSGIENDGNPNVTSTGMRPGPYVVAVDPNVIPYGSNVLIIYEDGDYLLGVAGDTGGAIKGNRLDVFKWTYAEACEFGIKTAKVVYW